MHKWKVDGILAGSSCDHCQEPLGLVAKAKRCKVCRIAVHPRCADVARPCMGKRPSKTSARINQDILALVVQAAQEKTPESVARLLDEQPQLMAARDESSQTALFLAVTEQSTPIVQILLDRMAPALVNARDQYGNTALHIACSVRKPRNDEVLEALLEYPQLEVSTVNHDLNSALHYFCRKYVSTQCARIGKMILKKGGLPLLTQKNKQEETALHSAMLNDQVRVPMTRFLLQAATVDRTDDESAQMQREFVNMPNARGETALHYAVRLHRNDLLRLLLTAGADMNLRATWSQSDKTPLELAGHLAEITGAPDAQTVKATLDTAEELRKWLATMDLERYLPSFISNDLQLDDVGDLLTEDLVAMGITTRGHQLRLMKAVKKMTKAESSRDEKRRKKKHIPEMKDSATNDLKAQLEKLKHIRSVGHWIKDEQLEYLNELGSGAAGEVFAGILTHTDGSKHQVAIKVLKQAKKEAEIADFKQEFQMLCAIETPYVVRFFGASLEPRLCMVMELCECGSLYDVLSDAAVVNLGWTQVLEWMCQLFEGVACLHENKPQILHRDLKSLNLLCNKDYILKIADFGLSRFNVEDNMQTFFSLRGTPTHSAPEVYDGKAYTERSDVFSNGIIMWELVNRVVTGEYARPYAEYPHLNRPMVILTQVAKRNKRPTIHEKCPESVAKLMARCWSADAPQRPTAREGLVELRAIQADFKKDPSAWLDSEADAAKNDEASAPAKKAKKKKKGGDGGEEESAPGVPKRTSQSSLHAPEADLLKGDEEKKRNKEDEELMKVAEINKLGESGNTGTTPSASNSTTPMTSLTRDMSSRQSEGAESRGGGGSGGSSVGGKKKKTKKKKKTHA